MTDTILLYHKSGRKTEIAPPKQTKHPKNKQKNPQTKITTKPQNYNRKEREGEEISRTLRMMISGTDYIQIIIVTVIKIIESEKL